MRCGHRCFEDKGVDAKSILKPGEWVNLMTVEFCIFGPAINATSLPDIAQHFVNAYRVILIPYDLKVTAMEVDANASSHGTSAHALPANLAAILRYGMVYVSIGNRKSGIYLWPVWQL